MDGKLLILRNDQLMVLEGVAEAVFCERAIDYLLRTMPEVSQKMSREHLLASVRYALLRCRGLGSDREIDVLRYLNLMYVFGFRFEELPWARPILRSKLHPQARMEWLCDQAMYVASRRTADGRA